MSHAVPACSLLVAACIFAFAGDASAHPMDDMCSAPKMNTNKWQSRSEVDGMTLLVPPGFTEGGHSVFQETQDTHFYQSGEHRSIAVGSGSGPAFIQHSSDVSENSECETVIAGRRVTMTMYHWVVEDALLSASGDAGPHFVEVARFYATGSRREVYVALASTAPSDLKYFKQFFWTVSFDGAPGAALASATPTATSAPPAACVPAPTPGLPTPDAVLDSATVRMLIASAAPVPHGFEIMALQFDGTGELAGMSVAQSDLPESSQRELFTVIATNLKPHDAHAPSTFLLRIDSSDTGFQYAVLPNAGCAQ